MDQAREELVRIQIDERALPIRELDAAKVFRAAPVLREEAHPVLPVTPEFDAAWPLHPADATAADLTDRR